MHSLLVDNGRKICAFTGHRPSRIPGSENENAPALRTLHASIDAALRQAVAEGYTVFRSGGAMGFDLWCAETILRIKKEQPSILLHFILPCETQANSWPECWRERYFNALADADEVTYIQTRFNKNCVFRRNRALIDGAHLVIACYDGSPVGGTAYTVQYAEKKLVPIRNIYV